jgi:hypothetical protein
VCVSQTDINIIFQENLRDLYVVKHDFICSLVRTVTVGTVQPDVRFGLETSGSVTITDFWGMRSRGLIYL